MKLLLNSCCAVLLITYSINFYGKNLIPCSIIHNFTQSPILVTWDPDWDDQVLTYGVNDQHKSQKILRKGYAIASFANITICNKFSFNFEIANEYMSGIMIGSIEHINNDGISLVLGTRNANSNLVITNFYNFSQELSLAELPSTHIQTNQIFIRKSPLYFR